MSFNLRARAPIRFGKSAELSGKGKYFEGTPRQKPFLPEKKVSKSVGDSSSHVITFFRSSYADAPPSSSESKSNQTRPRAERHWPLYPAKSPRGSKSNIPL